MLGPLLGEDAVYYDNRRYAYHPEEENQLRSNNGRFFKLLCATSKKAAQRMTVRYVASQYIRALACWA